LSFAFGREVVALRLLAFCDFMGIFLLLPISDISDSDQKKDRLARI